jgi:RND family efflux transporter MFP subunit
MINKSILIRHIQFFVIILMALAVSQTSYADGEKFRDHRIRTLLVPTSESVISSPIAGRIIEMKDQVGSVFSRDDTLVRFDCAELNAKLTMAQAEQASADVILKTKEELFKLQSAGETEVALAAAAASKAKAQVMLQKVLADSCVIRAPFDGGVVKVSARAFQSVNQGQTLLEIVSLAPPRARMNIPSRWLTWLQPGTKFQLTVDETGRTYTGIITVISARVDAVSQTVEVEGEVVSAASLVSGMSGYATFRQQGKKR